ncbi:MAG: alpha/beta hydrolase [Microthrixaceae bacterium]
MTTGRLTAVRRPPPDRLVVDGLSVERYAALDGGSTAAAPVLFVHGTGDRAAGLRRTARFLPNRRLAAYDRRGYAGSLDAGSASSVDEMVADAVAVAACLDGPVLLVGHSMGGHIALRALERTDAAEHFVGAVVWEPPMPDADWYDAPIAAGGLPAVDEVGERFFRLMVGDEVWRRLPDSLRAQRRAEGPALLADLVSIRRPGAAVRYERIGLPVVVGAGTESPTRHRRSAAETAERVGVPLTVVTGADHGVHLSYPAVFARLVEQWPSHGGAFDATPVSRPAAEPTTEDAV